LEVPLILGGSPRLPSEFFAAHLAAPVPDVPSSRQGESNANSENQHRIRGRRRIAVVHPRRFGAARRAQEHDAGAESQGADGDDDDEALTPEQTGKVAELNLTYANKMDPLIKGSAGPLVRMREMKQINHAKEAQLKQILTPQQFEKYLASKEQMRENLAEKVQEKSKVAPE
jgi:hypothetical protein